MTGKTVLSVLFLLCFLGSQMHVLAQSPNFSGIWVLNFEKSKLEHRKEGLSSSVFLIQQEGDQFNLVRYHIFGEKKNKLGFKMTADGKTRTVKLLFKGKLERQENSLTATLSRKNFLNVVNYKFGSNQDEFIADEVFKGYPQDHHNIWVFDRETTKPSGIK